MDSAPKELVTFYFKRGSMESFIKESKNGFAFTAVVLIRMNSTKRWKTSGGYNPSWNDRYQ